MTTMSETKSRFEQLLSEIYNRRLRESKPVCIDCLKPRSNKITLSVKNVAALTFMCSIIKILYL